jgi:oligosaccharide repeat unit polymerase
VLLGGLFPVRAVALWTILWFVLAFQAGSLMVGFRSPGPLDPVETGDEGIPTWLIRRIRWAITGLSLVALYGLMGTVGSGLGRYGLGWSWDQLLQMGQSLAVERYTTGAQTPGVYTFGLYCVFPATLLAGLLLGSKWSRWDLALAAIPLVLSLFGGLAVAARLGIFLAGTMGAAGFLAARTCHTRGRYTPFSAVTMFALIPLSAALIGLFVLLQWVRDGSLVSWMLYQAMASVFGSVATFGEWLSMGRPGSPTLGTLTFAGPFSLLGLHERAGWHPVFFVRGSESNIFTMFRTLIEDFGMVGGWAGCMAAGAGAGFVHGKCKENRLAWVLPLALCYFLLIFTGLNSPLAYNSVWVGWIIAALVWCWPPFRPAALSPSRMRGAVGEPASF